LSAYLGLVPRQHSSGGKSVLLGITKRGDRYLRTLLIHGARSALRQCKGDARSGWARCIGAERGPNVAAVADWTDVNHLRHSKFIAACG
jgi:transposase